MIQRIIILGPQGSGKGTQGKRTAEKFGIPLISAGVLWRKEIADGTEWGKKMEEVLRRGDLAPDQWTAELVARRLKQPDAQKGFILDGYPRNRAQFDLLDSVIAPTRVLALTLSDHAAIKRMAGRMVCPQCGTNYHVVYNPPKNTKSSGTWFCDADEAMLIVREDDKPTAVQKRLNIYHAETEPLLALYRTRGILLEIDASQSIEKVQGDIMRVWSL